jgi:hypothetical protein
MRVISDGHHAAGLVKGKCMKYWVSAIIGLTVTLVTGCAMIQKNTETEPVGPVNEIAPTKEKAKEKIKEIVKESSKKEPGGSEAEITGKAAKGSKFGKLKIGLTLGQVEKLLGTPTKQTQHATSKASIPFYFGPDRWVIQYTYIGEGVLTFNSGGEQLLTQIDVNNAE